MTGQLLGLGLGVLLLQQFEDRGPGDLLAAWAVVQAAHIALRYRALSCVQLRSLNLKRAAFAAQAHVRGEPVPSVPEANAQEALFVPPALAVPWVHLGCSLHEFATACSSSGDDLPSVLQLFSAEPYAICWQDGVALVLIKEGAGGSALLRAIWTAAWLQAYASGPAGGLGLLSRAVEATVSAFPRFAAEAKEAGWSVEDHTVVILTGAKRVRLSA